MQHLKVEVLHLEKWQTADLKIITSCCGLTLWATIRAVLRHEVADSANPQCKPSVSKKRCSFFVDKTCTYQVDISHSETRGWGADKILRGLNG